MTTTQQRPTEVRLTAEAAKDYGMEAYARKADQTTAQYDPLGATGEQACANCLFFISPNCCTVVEDWPIPISPTGLSRFWTAYPAPSMGQPVPVVIVEPDDIPGVGERSNDGDKGLMARIVAAVKGAFAPVANDHHDAGAFRLYQTKAADGSGADGWRWVAIVSNKYRDHDSPPEIIAEAAHREYVEYLDKSGEYPEAWLWHTPKTRWGKADFADYTTDGFLIMAGTVDRGMESVAAKLHGQPVGVSHGFYQRYSDKSNGVIGWYRSFEVSALPPEAAANQWTAMSVLQKEAAIMAFTPAKRAFLETTLGAEKVRALEGDIGALAKALQDAGVEYKDLEAATGDVVPAVAAVPVGLSVKDIGDAVTKALQPLSATVAELAGSVAAVKANADQIPGVLTRLAALEKSDDDKIADAFKARTSGNGAGGYRASQSGDTALKDGEEAALGQAPALVNPKFMAALHGTA